MKEYIKGLKHGLPIGLGYFPVAFTFGFIAVSGGLPVWLSVLISMSNLTSSGQFAGTSLIIANASYWEIILTTLVINIRYSLMSLSLTQKLKRDIPILHKAIFSFGITDEVFAVASLNNQELSEKYMYGLITLPYIGWAIGTLLGSLITDILPTSLQGAMGIALYAMFIALIIPPAKKSNPTIFVIVTSILTTCILKYVSIFSFISSGFRIIIATFIAAGLGAFLYPDSDTKREETT